MGGKEEKARACVLRMMMMRRPGLLAKARATKASSIEARQHSGADTIVECTHALQGTRREGGNSKNKRTSFLLLAGDRCCCFKEATSRRCSQGGLQHETKYEEGNKHEYT